MMLQICLGPSGTSVNEQGSFNLVSQYGTQRVF
jgi:hypothetical protein